MKKSLVLIIALILFCATRAGAFIQLYQQSIGSDTSNGTLVFPAITARASDLLVLTCALSANANAITGVTDTVSDTWSRAGSSCQYASGGTEMEIWYSVTAGGSVGVQVVHNTSQVTNCNLSEWSDAGTNPATVLDTTTACAQGLSNAPMTNAILPNFANDLVIGGDAQQFNQTITQSPANWQAIAAVTNLWSLLPAFNVQAAAFSQSQSWVTSVSAPWAGYVAAFKNVSPIATPTPGPTPTLTGTPGPTGTPTPTGGTTTPTPTPTPGVVCPQATHGPPLVGITGNLATLGVGQATNQRVEYHWGSLQNPSTSIIPGGSSCSTYSDQNGNLPLPPAKCSCFPQNAYAFVTIGSGQPKKIQFPQQNQAVLTSLVQANAAMDPVISSINICSAPTDLALTATNPPIGTIGPATLCPGAITGLQGVPICSTAPTTGQSLIFNSTQWCPGTPSAGTTFGNITTGNITANSVGGPFTIADYNGIAQDTFNPEAYGAKCDGSTDDTTALQAAATAAAGAVLLMPPSNCKINGTITLPANTVMQCSSGQPYSCVITNASTTAPTVVLTGGAGVTGGGIIGMRATRSALAAQNSGANGFQIAKNNVIGNFVMSYDWADNNDNGFYLGGTSYSTIDHWLSQTNANHGLFVTNGTGSGISQWLITNGLAQENGGDGIRIAAGTTTTTGALQVIGNNTFANCGHGIGLEGTATHIVTGVFLNGNILGEDNSNQIDITDAQTITITGNHLEGAGVQACGPSLGTGASNAAYAISMNMDVTRPNNINITGNHIFSSTYSCINDNAVIDQIVGNQLAACGAQGSTNQQKAGVYFAAGSGKHLLSSNQIEGNVNGVDNEGAAVDLTETGNFVFSNSSANEILGNTAAFASGNSGLVNSIPTMYNAAGGLFEGVTTGINVHIVEDGCIFSSATTCTKTLVAPAAFSNAFYTCTANDINAPNAVQIQAISGTSVTFTEAGSTSDTVKFICVGN